MAAGKDEVQEQLNELMKMPGAYGYVVINFDGIPVKHYPDDEENGIPAVQYAALIADLVMKTKQTLRIVTQGQEAEFSSLRMRTKKETELIVTDFMHSSGNEYILVAIQKNIFAEEEDVKNEGGNDEEKE